MFIDKGINVHLRFSLNGMPFDKVITLVRDYVNSADVIEERRQWFIDYLLHRLKLQKDGIHSVQLLLKVWDADLLHIAEFMDCLRSLAQRSFVKVLPLP